MMIVCPNCETSYDVSAASLGAEGRSVRCVRCGEVWFAAAEGAPAQPAAEAVDTVSAAAASARYQRAAPPTAEEPGAQPEDQWSGDEALSIDSNLAARAADRSAMMFDDPPLDAGAVGMEGDGEDAGALMPHDAPPLAPEADESAPPHIDAHADSAHPEDIESFAARRARREMLKRGRRIGRPSLATVILSLIAVNAALVGWRSDVVRLMPQTASLFAAIGLPVNLRGIAFTDVTTTREAHEGVSVLLVQGTIANISRQPHDVPRIRFAMRNAAGGEIYTWTTLPSRPALAPGETQPFQTRLASPPSDGHEVVVRFFNRHDAIGGVH
jgi:predicted Zn finger-like uncharacterized protein